MPQLPKAPPEAWGFGATPEQADDLLALVLSGTKTATAGSLWDYEAFDETLPQTGDLHIILDGADVPRALIETTELTVASFEAVSAEHAFLEGEGDRTLATWRTIHEQFWREHSENPRRFEPGMPVVCERFRLVYPTPAETNPRYAERDD